MKRSIRYAKPHEVQGVDTIGVQPLRPQTKRQTVRGAGTAGGHSARKAQPLAAQQEQRGGAPTSECPEWGRTANHGSASGEVQAPSTRGVQRHHGHATRKNKKNINLKGHFAGRKLESIRKENAGKSVGNVGRRCALICRLQHLEAAAAEAGWQEVRWKGRGRLGVRQEWGGGQHTQPSRVFLLQACT